MTQQQQGLAPHERDFHASLFSDVYIPAPSKPEGYDEEVRKITHGLGRVAWGQDLRCFRAGNPEAIKYPWGTKFGPDRFIFEVKVDLAAFPRNQWEESRYMMTDDGQVDLFGPYPNEMWGMKMPLMNMSPDNLGGYMPCDNRFLDWLRMNARIAEEAPVGKFASVSAYSGMVKELLADQAERDAQVDTRIAEHKEWNYANADRINREATRRGVLISRPKSLFLPDGTEHAIN